MKCGCIGKKLTHSFSKEIHALLADYRYDLIELNEEQIAGFFEQRNFDAVNVTIPYKQTVIPYLDVVSDAAQRIGAVNTVVNRGGRLFGYNTDYYGMKALLEKAGIAVNGKKVLILGTGGTSRTARVVARDLGAADIVLVSRRKSEHAVTYEEAAGQHADAQVIINTTPCGMYPDCDASPIGLAAFAKLEGVIDAVYNPLCTRLILEAKKRGVRAEGGLYMLVMQAIVAAEKFLDKTIEKAEADRVFAQVLAERENIVLIGMPGSGKSTVGRILQKTGLDFVDTDAEIEKRCGCAIRQLIERKGEAYFRDLEAEVVRDVSLESGRIIATGGGAVLRPENVKCLQQNGKLYFLNADLGRLRATGTRPLANTEEKIKKLYAERKDVYHAAADVMVPDMKTPEEEAAYIMQKRTEMIL